MAALAKCVILPALLSNFLIILVHGKSIDNLKARKVLLINFMEGNQNRYRGVEDERWMFKFLNENSVIPPETSSSSMLSDAPQYRVFHSNAVGTVACALGWKRYSVNGMCYKESSSSMSWYEAEEWCQRAGGHLASVHSQEEAKWLNSEYKVWYATLDDWIGLKRECDMSSYYWTDGSAVDFLWWQPGYPKAQNAEESCTTIWSTALFLLKPGYVGGQFDDAIACSESAASKALCKYDPNSESIAGRSELNPCASTLRTTTSATTTTTNSTTTFTTTTITTTVATPPTTTTTDAVTAGTETTPTPTTRVAEPTTPPTTTTTKPTIATTTSTTSATKSTASTTAPTTLFDDSKCAKRCTIGWAFYNGICYAKLQGPGRQADFNAECEKFGGKLANVDGSEVNEALRLFFSTNNAENVLEEAWITSSANYSNIAFGFSSDSGNCHTIILSSSDGVAYTKRGFWRPYSCSAVKEYGICEKAA